MGSRRLAAAALAAVALFVTAQAVAQTGALTTRQSEALATYERALGEFKAVLAERRKQIDAKQPLPNLPGQALYLARVAVISSYKDLTDAMVVVALTAATLMPTWSSVAKLVMVEPGLTM